MDFVKWPEQKRSGHFFCCNNEKKKTGLKGEQVMEIVFSDSARGSLLLSQAFGRGAYPENRNFGVAFSDGHEPTTAELKEIQRQAGEQERRKWERSIPMQGQLEIACFALKLSVGDISETIPGPLRQASLEKYFTCWRNGDKPWSAQTMEQAATSLEKLRAQAAAGKPLRIWYSDCPDELCGFYWLMALLESMENCGPVSAVYLPHYEEREDGCVVEYTGWHEIHPGDWGHCLSLEKTVPDALKRTCANRWRALQQENAPLRAVLNGRLVSAPEELYDSFIRREIAKEKTEFQEACVIGNVIGRQNLKISDAWIAYRIENMVQKGEFEAVTQPEPDDPVYHRILRKK